MMPLTSSKCDPKSQALMFVQRIEQGKLLSKALNCDFYQGSSDKEFTNKDRDAAA